MDQVLKLIIRVEHLLQSLCREVGPEIPVIHSHDDAISKVDVVVVVLRAGVEGRKMLEPLEDMLERELKAKRTLIPSATSNILTVR